LLIVDPCNIDTQWKEEEFLIDEIAVFPDGTEEKLERLSKRWFELIKDINAGKIKVKKGEKVPKNHFSYNAICHATLESEKGFASMPYELGHEGLGVVFNSGIGDGFYPVYCKIENIPGMGKRITEVRIDMTEHPLLEKYIDVNRKGKKKV
jgi:hypothetical protein